MGKSWAAGQEPDAAEAGEIMAALVGSGSQVPVAERGASPEPNREARGGW